MNKPLPNAAETAPARLVPGTTNPWDGGEVATVRVAPTQVRRPWRSTIRTAVQVAIPTLLALGVVVPQVVQVILDEVGEAMPPRLRLALLGISAGIVTAAAIVTRVMAIPQVELLLRRFKLTSWLAAAPATKAEG